MKVVKAKEMSRIENLAYKQGASEEEYMNQAGQGVAECVQNYIGQHHLKPFITLLCGSGNNAGDAYAAGVILIRGGFHVKAFSFSPLENSSELCQLQSKRFEAAGGQIKYFKDAESLSFEDTELLIDGILGTGFHGELKGFLQKVIEAANHSKIPIISIDIPSGVDGNTGEAGGAAIRANKTVFLGLPKTGCFLGKAWNYTGAITVHNFGLPEGCIIEADPDFILIDDLILHQLFPSIARTRHKYQAGYVVGLGGSPGMPGAPTMSSFAALRSGAGIVRLLHPSGMETEFASAPFEVIRQAYNEGDAKTILDAMERASAVFIGPGIGMSPNTLKLLKKVLPAIQHPCVIDAEALTLLSQDSIPLPPKTILTPHQGEMKKLLHCENDIGFSELIEKSQEYVEQMQLTLVLKGAPTFIFHPDHTPYVCSRGDPGMATAGSGDILTGVISAFLAQVLDPLEAAILGVQCHAMAGEYAAQKWTSHCMVATDILEGLPNVYKQVKFGGHIRCLPDNL